MANSLIFTKNSLLKIKPPQRGRDVYRDAKEKGLILVVSYGGSKTFYLYKFVDGKPKRIKIGSFPNLSVEETRKKVLELKNQIAKKYNPVDEKVNYKKDLTFKELFDKYINEYAKHNTKRWKDVINQMDRQAKFFYDQKISAITKSDILRIFNDLTNAGTYTANRFLETLSSIFNKAVEWGLMEKNPINGIKKHKEKSRDRYMIPKEVPRFFEALEAEANQKVKDFILLSLYTGARKSNVLSLKWENINFQDKTWYISGHNTKNGEPQLLPLVNEAIKILKERKEEDVNGSEWVFPSSTSASGHLEEPRKVWNRILKTAGIKDLRLHDLRRTVGSYQAISGSSLQVIGKSLGHKTIQATKIYAHINIDPVRESINRALELMKTYKAEIMK